MLSNLDTPSTRAACVKKMKAVVTQQNVITPQLGNVMATHLVQTKNRGGDAMTVKQVIKHMIMGVGVAAAPTHEDIATSLEALTASGVTAYQSKPNTVFRDDIGRPILQWVYLTPCGLRHLLSTGNDSFAIDYRETVFKMNETLVAMLQGIQEYNQNRVEWSAERSAAHQETQNYLTDHNLVPRRQKRNKDGALVEVSPKKQASAATALTYQVGYYPAAISATKRPREAALDVGIEMTTTKPIIGQVTKICMEGAFYFQGKVRRKLELARQQGVPMSAYQAAIQVKETCIRRGTFVEQDLDDNDLNADDQVRAMTDNTFAATGVPSSSLLTLTA